MKVIATARTAAAVARALGSVWLVRRLAYSAALRLGVLRRRLPMRSWSDEPLADWCTDRPAADPIRLRDRLRSETNRFLFASTARDRFRPILLAWDAALQPAEANASSIVEADEVVAGRVRYFSGLEAVLGQSPDWHANPFTGQRAPADRHWSDLGDFAHGDIKVIWEPSRFAFVYPLVRAYWRTGDDRYAQTFWRLVESWRAANPPQAGPNWKCGQETSLRAMAWCFGLWGFLDHAASTPDRVAMLTHMIAVSGRRVEANLSYAINQRNNHGVSEATGLWTVGLLFPELRDATRWRDTGRRTLELCARELIYEDGAFSQHSTNYHRLMLQAFLWSIRLGDTNGQPLSESLRTRVGLAVRFVDALLDPGSGGVPTIGPNDGSYILPLANTDYDDYRPVVQAGAQITAGRRALGNGPWDEAVLWLTGMDATNAPVVADARGDLRARAGGYYTLRTTEGFATFRCVERFRDRPAHADLLHVDIWWRGENIAIDAGSFSYNDASRPALRFEETATHNTVIVDGASQMRRASRFLWAPWARGQLLHPSPANGTERPRYLEGLHTGYRWLGGDIVHRRALTQVEDDLWIVADEIRGADRRLVTLHWLLADVPYRSQADAGQIMLDTAGGAYGIATWTAPTRPGTTDLIRGGAVRGWRARRYGTVEPAISLETSMIGPPVARFLTALGPSTDGWRWSGDGDHRATLLRGERPTATVTFDRSPGYLVDIGAPSSR